MVAGTGSTSRRNMALGLVTGLSAFTGLMLAQGVASAAVATGATPGGTVITVEITIPADGAMVPAGPLSVTGTAGIGEPPGQLVSELTDVSVTVDGNPVGGVVTSNPVPVSNASVDFSAIVTLTPGDHTVCAIATGEDQTQTESVSAAQIGTATDCHEVTVLAPGPVCTIDRREATSGGPLNPIVGTNGRDVICGSRFGDIIMGKGGDDEIFGFGGTDVIDAGSGDDLVFGGDGNDSVNGGDGDDILVGEAGGDFVNGNAGTDICAAETRLSCEQAAQAPA